jgi:hypothetical protein
MKKFFWLILFSSSLIFLETGCSSSLENSISSKANDWVSYEEIQCHAYPWQWGKHKQGIVDSRAIINYFHERFDLTISQVEVVTQKEQVCETCGCKTGTVIQLLVSSKEDRKALESLGFRSTEEPSLSKQEKLGEKKESNQKEKKVVDIKDSVANNNLNQHTGADGLMEQNAKYIQQMLWAHFFEQNAYPKLLGEIDLTGVDLKGITYIPKGKEPFEDYELHVEFSDVIEIYHPMP